MASKEEHSVFEPNWYKFKENEDLHLATFNFSYNFNTLSDRQLTKILKNINGYH